MVGIASDLRELKVENGLDYMKTEVSTEGVVLRSGTPGDLKTLLALTHLF